MTNPYVLVTKVLSAHSINAYIQTDNQLVIARQEDPAWPDKGNSFWITYVGGQWYLCTWVPVCYRVPAVVSITQLCIEFVERGNSAQPVVPDDLVFKYGLSRLSEKEAACLVGA